MTLKRGSKFKTNWASNMQSLKMSAELQNVTDCIDNNKTKVDSNYDSRVQFELLLVLLGKIEDTTCGRFDKIFKPLHVRITENTEHNLNSWAQHTMGV